MTNRVITMNEYRERKSTPRPARVVAVTGGKGGVGKSIISVNLAVASAEIGSRALALDADLGMADMNLLLGLAPSKSLLDIVQGCPVEEVMVEAHGIHVLPALNGSYQLANMDARARRTILSEINRLEDRFDLVVLDIPAGIDENSVHFTGAASHVIVVLTPEPVSLADAYACLKALSIHQNVRHAYVLPNMVRSQTEAEETFARLSAIVDRFLGLQLTMLPMVPLDSSVPFASGAGIPVVKHSPDSPAARAMRQVARAVDAFGPPEDRQDPMRLFTERTRGGVSQEA